MTRFGFARVTCERLTSWGKGINGAVGELGWHNLYAYANGNPVNLVDPSGMIAERPEQWDNCGYQNRPSRSRIISPVVNVKLLSTDVMRLTSDSTDIGWGGFIDDFSDQPCSTAMLSYVKFETRWGPYEVGWSATDNVHESGLDHDYYVKIGFCPTQWCTVLSWFPTAAVPDFWTVAVDVLAVWAVELERTCGGVPGTTASAQFSLQIQTRRDSRTLPVCSRT
jgi:hypothetical protein